jgi:hypothetical protein
MQRKRFIQAEFAGPSTLNDDDLRWEDLILTIEESFRTKSSNE